MQPTLIGDPPKLKIGFCAKNKILKGDELFFDYGIRDTESFPWLATDAKKVKTTGTAVETSNRTSSSVKKRPPANRLKRSCPIPGCRTRDVSRLADHIRVLHPEVSVTEREALLKQATNLAKSKIVSTSGTLLYFKNDMILIFLER